MALTAADADFLLVLANGTMMAVGSPSDLEGSPTNHPGKEGNHGDSQVPAVQPEELNNEVQELIQQTYK